TSVQSFAPAALACGPHNLVAIAPAAKARYARLERMGSFQDEVDVWKSAVPTREVEEEQPNKAKQATEFRQHYEFNLAGLAASIGWRTLGDGAAARKLRRLDRAKRKRIDAAAHLPQVRKVAAEIGLLPTALVLGLMARFMTSRDRHAARIAK